jgi:hypothetical protein
MTKNEAWAKAEAEGAAIREFAGKDMPAIMAGIPVDVGMVSLAGEDGGDVFLVVGLVTPLGPLPVHFDRDGMTRLKAAMDLMDATLRKKEADRQ